MKGADKFTERADPVLVFGRIMLPREADMTIHAFSLLFSQPLSPSSEPWQGTCYDYKS